VEVVNGLRREVEAGEKDTPEIGARCQDVDGSKEGGEGRVLRRRGSGVRYAGLTGAVE